MKARIVPVYPDKYIVQLKQHWYSRWESLTVDYVIEAKPGYLPVQIPKVVVFFSIQEAQQAIDHLKQIKIVYDL